MSEGEKKSPHQASSINLPTLDQALPYCPLSSILPFPSDVIKIPDSNVPSQPPSLLSESEQSALHHALHILNSSAGNSESLSNGLPQTLNDLSRTVDPRILPHYCINVPSSLQNIPLPSAHGHASETAKTQSLPVPSTDSTLSPFARMALQATSIPYSLSSPTASHSNGIGSASNTTVSHIVASSGQTSTSQRATAPSSQGPTYPMVVIPSQQNPLITRPTVENNLGPQGYNISQQVVPRVILPGFPLSTDASQYNSHPEADALALSTNDVSPRKRKRDPDDFEETFVPDGRDLADAEVRTFQELLINIFEAENQLDPHAESSVQNQSQSYFVLDRDGDGASLALLPALLATVDSASAKIIKLKRFAQIPIEQLLHLQQILLGSLRHAFEVDLTHPSDITDDTAEQWHSRLDTAENSLRASKVLLSMMTAGRSEKELCSEELTAEIVNNLSRILETGVLPLAESQSALETKELFKSQPQLRSVCISLLQRAGRVLKLLGSLLLVHDLSEATVTSIEFLATKIIFSESSSSDKESVLGLQKFEALRRHAMDVVAAVFLQYPDQRSFLLNEILSSLEKLPVTRQSARQFRLLEGKPIQLVSALIMQLVQTSTMKDSNSESANSYNNDNTNESGDESSGSDESQESSYSSSGKAKQQQTKRKTSINISKGTSISKLEEVSATVAQASQSNASYISRYLVQRALTSTKTGDQPYRNLLDIFTEDLLNVLDSPEWPAAELLLRALLSSFLGIMGEEKGTAPAKNLALDLMGTIGSKIADLRKAISQISESSETNMLNIIENIQGISGDILHTGNLTTIVNNKDGPYRIVVDFLQRAGTESPQQDSARRFYIVQWARNLCSDVHSRLNESSEANLAQNTPTAETASWLLNMLEDHHKQFLDHSAHEFSRSEVRTCHALVLLSLPLCQAFDRIFHALVTALSSQQATVRSRSVKSVSLLLDKDPSILKRSTFIMQRILQSASDPSPLVRDSALVLVGKCININPELRTEATKTLVANSADHSVAVRKRAMKLLRELYLDNKQQDVRAVVADAVLQRLNDIEESIAELSAHTMEDIWLSPFQSFVASAGSLSSQNRKSLQQHVALIAATVTRGDDIATSVESLLQKVLNEGEKTCKLNRDVCKLFVSTLFESIIDNAQEVDVPSQKSSFQTLTVFARADPSLFNADQMLTLRPYIDNVSFTPDELPIYRSTISIYRRVLPVLPPLQKTFLLGVQEVLLKTVSKLGRQELEEVATCLSIIDGVLENTERLARLVASVLRNIEATQLNSLSEDNELKRLRKLLMLAGAFGKACNLEGEIEFFKQAFPSRKIGSISTLIIDTINPLASVECPEAVRETALESIGLVCQSWPQNYLLPRISKTFHDALEGSNPRLLIAILSGFRSFYMSEDSRTKTGEDASKNETSPTTVNRLGKSMTVTHNDGAATSIAQQFLPRITNIALSSRGYLALIATDIIASTNRQGLVHPRECGPTLVALGTSPEDAVAKVAYDEHQNLHAKHESMLDKEYIKAVEQAFDYQCSTWKSPLGIDTGLNPKLRVFYEVLRSGSLALRKKLFTNLCTKLILDGSKVTDYEALNTQLQFSRFVLENISLFEYGRIEELQQLTLTIEKLFSSWGDPLSQRIEALLNAPSNDPMFPEHASSGDVIAPTMAPQTIDVSKLKLVTIESMILSLLWQTRTFLCRAWNLQSSKLAKPKTTPKDVNKAPTRITNPPFEEHLANISQIMAALQNEDTMKAQCTAFLGLLTVDGDLKFESDDDANSSRPETPSEDRLGGIRELDSGAPVSGSGRRGFRRSVSTRLSTPSSTPRTHRLPSAAVKQRTSQIYAERNDNDIGNDDEASYTLLTT